MPVQKSLEIIEGITKVNEKNHLIEDFVIVLVH